MEQYSDLTFNFKHIYTVSDGNMVKYENRKSYNEFLFKWLHWSYQISKELLLITDESRVHLFKLSNKSDENCQYFKTIDFNKNTDLKGVCLFKNNNLCLVDGGASSLILIDEEFKITKKLDLNITKRWLYSCEQLNFKIYITDRHNCTVIIINENFEFEKEVEVKLPDMFKKMISLREIKIKDEKVFLTDNDYGNQCMHIFDLNFNYIKSFGINILKNPYSFFFYKQEYIFVIERSNKIHVFDKDLIFKTCKTLSNCDSAINGIILDDKILISSLIVVNILNLNTRRIEQKLVSKIDTYKI
jgi:hypothetical protein